MSAVLFESGKDTNSYTWTLNEDCIVLPSGERVSLWNACAGGVHPQGNGYSLTIYTNCMGMTADEVRQKGARLKTTSIFSRDEIKLESVAKHMNGSTASPQDMPPMDGDGARNAITDDGKKNAALWIAIAVVLLSLAALCFNLFSS